MDKSTGYLLNAPSPEDDLFEHIAHGIEERGYAHLPGALPSAIADSLVEYVAQLEGYAFHRAATGRKQHQIHNQFVRRDRIHWIAESHPASAQWIAWSQRLRAYLNRRLFLGLFSFESHFSHYQAGDFYRKHVDAFKGESNRILSLVAYLNRGWEPDQGGELVIYSPEDESELFKVTPTFATLVLFLSEEFSHEVLPTTRDRFAVAGWYRLNNSINDNIDPPC
ncbi:MAG: 2OG-Fe(II) oxygenase [Pseudomonadales bacterium]|nr:2OG-Fe(II) oxygenase [Pseudomonadales bacterium]MBL6816325.1 2OG-Fe(II) oxygenase [Pseudomonadales bacterium]